MYESVRYHLEQIQYQSEINWHQVDDVFSDLSSQQIVRCCDYFLKCLSPNHNVPGSVYEQIQGIGYWVRENQNITVKQSRWLALAFAAYWDQLDPQARS